MFDPMFDSRSTTEGRDVAGNGQIDPADKTVPGYVAERDAGQRHAAVKHRAAL
jgi:hypothetical protein